MAKEVKFKIGDRVLLRETSMFADGTVKDNPLDTPGIIEIIDNNKYLPIKVQWDNGEYNLYNVEDLKLFKTKEMTGTLTSKMMKDAVQNTAKKLLKANNTVTTLEIKAELRIKYPHFYWTQSSVSSIMDELYHDGLFSFKDNGIYRTYSHPTATKKVNSTTIKKVSAPRKVAKAPSVVAQSTISKTKALDLIKNSKGHFFTATFTKKDNTQRTINCQYLKDQTASDLGYVKVKEAAKLKANPKDSTRQINIQTLTTLKIGGNLYKIRK